MTVTAMAPKYEVGQKVAIKLTKSKQLSPRDANLKQFIGKSGEITDYHWISMDRGVNVFYLYTVRIGDEKKEVVLHEDELIAFKT